MTQCALVTGSISKHHAVVLLDERKEGCQRMYVPVHFEETRLSVQHDLIEAHPLALLITSNENGPLANLVPVLRDRTASAKGTLKLHLARANPQWKHLAAGDPCLVVFQGVDAYVTPGWYETKRETGKVVPTWNYATVQVRGRATVHEDAHWLKDQVSALTGVHEAGQAKPWGVTDAPDDFITSQLRAIVGVEIEITDITGKWKVSQNRNAADAAGVVEGLRESSDAEKHEMADLVEKARKPV